MHAEGRTQFHFSNYHNHVNLSDSERRVFLQSDEYQRGSARFVSFCGTQMFWFTPVGPSLSLCISA
jgi:hypothetical protein